MNESRSTTTAKRAPTESSERSSWVDLEWIDPSTIDKPKWIRLAQILKKVVSESAEMDLVALLKDVKNSDAAIWGIVDKNRGLRGAVVCRVCEFPSTYSVLLIQAIATEGTRMSRTNMRTLVAKLEEVGRVSDCDAVRICGRPEWGRVFEDYVHVGATFDKVIREES